MKQLENLSFVNGSWVQGNEKIIGPLSHGSWMGSPVFDGARYFNGVAPDLKDHCKRVIKSAKAMLMDPKISYDEIFDLSIEGIKKLGKDKDIYIRPLIWAEDSMGLLRCDPSSTNFCLSIIHMPMPTSYNFTACISKFTRPTPLSAPTDAKAACLYPNGARAMNEAFSKGFDNAVVMDPYGNVAEFASSNIFIVKNKTVITPKDNGTYLAGITRNTTLKLCKALNINVLENDLSTNDLYNADEIFSTGNYGKLMYVNKLDNIKFKEGCVFKKIKQAYLDYSQTFKII